MDSYLSGRERVGDKPKPKEPAKLTSEAIGKLVPANAPELESKEECGAGGSKVSYVMEDGKVTRIVVTCACGQVTEIDCQYED